jgi:hypothetical protein
MGELWITLPDGSTLSFAQLWEYGKLHSEHSGISWHRCENGCCMVVHDATQRTWTINQRGDVREESPGRNHR